MLEVSLIGYLGANAEVKTSERGEFVTMRISHDDSWTDEAGQKHGGTMWVDVTMSCRNGRPAVLPYLVAGTLVFVRGSLSLRVYSSQKDRCMKAGATVNARDLQLLGGKVDVVPKQLVNPVDGSIVNVSKYYWADLSSVQLTDKHGQLYQVDDRGFITPVVSHAEATESVE